MSQGSEGGTDREPIDQYEGLSSYIVVLRGRDAGLAFLMEANEIVIGRHPGSALPLRDPEVSREHARLLRHGRKNLVIEDLGSTNGTFCNRMRVQGSRSLCDGDLLELGGTTILVTSWGGQGERPPNDSFGVQVRRNFVRGRPSEYLGLRLRSELAFSNRHNLPLALMVVGLDSVDELTALLGAGALNRMAARTGDAIGAALRRPDSVIHLEEDSFVIIAPGTRWRAAACLAERIRLMIRDLHPDGVSPQLPTTATISVGIAPEPAFGSGQAFLRIVQLAMMAARLVGRDQVVPALDVSLMRGR